jgi:hypothetical protein
MRHRPAAALLTLCATALPAYALGPGDLQFVSFNADNDSVAIVTLVDLTANSSFYVTNNAWTGSGFAGGESFHRWDSGTSAIAAGTVIQLSGMASGLTPGASQGSLSRVLESGSSGSVYGMSQTADTLYLYAGSSATMPTQFLSAISTDGFSGTEGSLGGTGLEVGVHARKKRESWSSGCAATCAKVSWPTREPACAARMTSPRCCVRRGARPSSCCARIAWTTSSALPRSRRARRT